MQSFLQNFIQSLISKVNSSKWLKVEFNLKKVFVVEFNMRSLMADFKEF